jgi:hypothetical protein
MNGQAQEVDTWDESFTADSNEFQGQQEQSPPQESWEIPYEPPVRDPDVPTWVDNVADLDEYTANLIGEVKNRIGGMLAEEKLRSRVESAVARARDSHNGQDGLPVFDDLINDVIPLIEQQPGLKQLVLAQDDPASAAYLIGFCARYPHLVGEVFARKGRLDSSIFRSSHFRATVQGRNSGRGQPSGKV